jgi:hypothetical protein
VKLPGALILIAARLAMPLTIGYIASAAWYIYEIVRTLDIRTAGQPPILFARGHEAGDLFAVVGTFQWLAFGINRRASGTIAVGSLILAGLHILLLAIRAYIVPMLWIMEQISR